MEDDGGCEEAIGNHQDYLTYHLQYSYAALFPSPLGDQNHCLSCGILCQPPLLEGRLHQCHHPLPMRQLCCCRLCRIQKLHILILLQCLCICLCLCSSLFIHTCRHSSLYLYHRLRRRFFCHLRLPGLPKPPREVFRTHPVGTSRVVGPQSSN